MLSFIVSTMQKKHVWKVLANNITKVQYVYSQDAGSALLFSLPDLLYEARSKRRTLPKILHQILHITHVPP